MKRIKIRKLIDLILFSDKQPKVIYFQNKKYVYHKYIQDYFNYENKKYMFKDEYDFFKHLDEEVIVKEN